MKKGLGDLRNTAALAYVDDIIIAAKDYDD